MGCCACLPCLPCVQGGGVQGFKWWRTCSASTDAIDSGTQIIHKHKAKKALYLRLYPVGGIIIPLQPIKPFICPQIEPQGKNRKTTSEEKKKNPAQRRGKFYYLTNLFVQYKRLQKCNKDGLHPPS